MRVKKYFLFFCIISLSFCLNAKTVRVGYYKDSGNFMSGMSEEDPKYGYAYEYLQNIASYTGWDYEYVYGYFDELYDALLSGEIDLLSDISYTPERTKLMYFPDYAMGAETYYLYAHNDDTSISADDLSTLNGKTMALGLNSYQHDVFLEWIKNHNLNIDITFMNYDDVSEEDFDNGLYDLFLSMDLVSEIQWEPIVKIGSSDIYTVVNHQRADILQELNEAQNALYLADPYFNNETWATYYSNSTVSKRLSPKEKGWLATHNQLNIGCLENNVPYAFKDKKGEVHGLITLLVSKLETVFEIPDEKINYCFYSDMDSLEAALAAGEIDCVFPMAYDLYMAEQRGESLSKPVWYTSLYYVRTPKVTNLTNVSTIAVTGGSRVENHVSSMDAFENKTIVPYDSVEACVNAVLLEDVSGAVINDDTVQQTLGGRKKYKNLLVTDTYDSIPYSIAVSKENTKLLSILNKVLSLTTSAEIQNSLLESSLINRSITFEEFLKDYLVIIITVCIILIALTIALIYAIGKIIKLINYDYLTKMLNRRKVSPRLKDFYYQAAMNGKMFSAIIFDLDHFKQVNDTYGHDCGDVVLKTAAEIIKKNLRPGDLAFRWGGEEFLVLLKCNVEKAAEYAENVRKNVEAQVIHYDENNIKITITAGVSTYTPDSTANSIFLAADKNLYRGKETGRNKVVW